MPDDIEHITDLSSVRRRPGMYFNLGSPLVANCMAREAYCLAIDQIVAGNCTELISEFTSDGFLTVSHNGQSLDVEARSGFGGFPEMLFVAERLGFCADFASSEYVNTHVCKNGMTALNGCCERFELHNFHKNTHYRLVYDCGQRLGDLQSLGPCSQRGVTIRFKPDATIVPNIKFDVDELKQWFTTIPIESSNTKVEWLDRREITMR